MKKPMEIVAEVHEEEAKKIFFLANGPMDNPRAGAELWDREKATKFVERFLKEAGVADKRFDSFRIESHVADGYEDDGSSIMMMSWGQDSPSIQFDDHGDQVGLLVELDGQEVFNNLKPVRDDEGDEEDEEDEEDGK